MTPRPLRYPSLERTPLKVPPCQRDLPDSAQSCQLQGWPFMSGRAAESLDGPGACDSSPGRPRSGPPEGNIIHPSSLQAKDSTPGGGAREDASFMLSGRPPVRALSIKVMNDHLHIPQSRSEHRRHNRIDAFAIQLQFIICHYCINILL